MLLIEIWSAKIMCLEYFCLENSTSRNLLAQQINWCPEKCPGKLPPRKIAPEKNFFQENCTPKNCLPSREMPPRKIPRPH